MAKIPGISPEIGALLALGWAIPVWLLVGIFGGRWFDVRWGTAPWLTLAGALFGIAGATWTVVRAVRKLDRTS